MVLGCSQAIAEAQIRIEAAATALARVVLGLDVEDVLPGVVRLLDAAGRHLAVAEQEALGRR